ncbi:MAG TPA: 3-phosphoshikimate 1-carboxyvinyltransferase [Phaeodactylibacter sp.]|nr:3-phosphoshikimate 1-carboxyvinyltransferase [Phaeodactylibacter sp.]
MLSIFKKDKILQGEITLNGSKSISNRALIIRALSGQAFSIKNISTSKDTQTLEKLLNQFSTQKAEETIELNTGHAGTTFRFLTGYLASQKGTQILTGSQRMKQRPIKILVDALQKLGANIEYLEAEGFPPLRIGESKSGFFKNKITIAADTSSQYISSLLMLAPTLPEGLELVLEGKIVSVPYIQMTLKLMQKFGIQHSWKKENHQQIIKIAPQIYQGKNFIVEADWSAASYYFSLAALADEVDLQLNGLFEKSTQGDAVIVQIMTKFGVATTFNEKGIYLKKSGDTPVSMFEYDFLECPDIAQTVAVVCGGLGTTGLFSGLDTLSIKETDRILALQNELQKVQVFFSKLPPHFSKKTNKTFYMIEGKAVLDSPTFATYEDHRMAMSFAPLALFGKINIEKPKVVEKSYPDFWKDLKALGFSILDEGKRSSQNV